MRWGRQVAHLSILAASSWVVLRKLIPFTSSIWSPIWQQRNTHPVSLCIRQSPPTTHLDPVDGRHGPGLHKGHVDPQPVLNPTSNAKAIPVTHLEEEVDLQGGGGAGQGWEVGLSTTTCALCYQPTFCTSGSWCTLGSRWPEGLWLSIRWRSGGGVHGRPFGLTQRYMWGVRLWSIGSMPCDEMVSLSLLALRMSCKGPT